MRSRRALSAHWKLVWTLLVAAAALLVIYASSRLQTANLPLTIVRIDSAQMSLIGWVILILSPVLLFLPAAAGFSVSFFVYLSLLASVLGYHPPQHGERTVQPDVDRVWVSEKEWYDRYQQADPRTGWYGVPNVTAKHHHEDFGKTVTYTMSPEGNRITPIAANAKQTQTKEIVFIGCSFTFGVGVEDDETFAAILAREAWPNYRVTNLACSAFGAAQSLKILEDYLNKGHRPAAVFYGWIHQHAERSYLRKSVRDVGMKLDFPLFELKEGELRDTGLVPWQNATLPDDEATTREEHRLTLALLQRMEESCARYQIPLVIIAMVPEPDPILMELAATRPVWVLTAGPDIIDRYPHEGHPTPWCHRMIAFSLANDRQVSEWVGAPNLYQPTAVRPAERRWLGRFDQANGSSMNLSVTPTGARADQMVLTGKEKWDPLVQLLPIVVHEPGEKSIQFLARSDAPRDQIVIVREIGFAGSNNLASQLIDCTPDWKAYSLPFTATPSTSMVSVSFGGTESAASFEIKEVQLSGSQPAQASASEQTAIRPLGAPSSGGPNDRLAPVTSRSP